MRSISFTEGGDMKKLWVAIIVIAAVGVAFWAYAQKEQVKIKTQETPAAGVTTIKAKGEKGTAEIQATTAETPVSRETEIKAKAKGPSEETKVQATTEQGEIRKATVEKTAVGTKPILQKKVKFHSMSKDGNYVTVVEQKQLVRYPTKDPKRPYKVKWEKMQPIEITATYDINKGQYVVDRALMKPVEEPLEEATKEDVKKALEKDAPPQK